MKYYSIPDITASYGISAPVLKQKIMSGQIQAKKQRTSYSNEKVSYASSNTAKNASQYQESFLTPSTTKNYSAKRKKEGGRCTNDKRIAGVQVQGQAGTHGRA